MQLNEGCLFRVHIDADWLETDIIAIEFRLMSTPVPESEQPASGEETNSKDTGAAAATPSPGKRAEKKAAGILKEVRSLLALFFYRLVGGWLVGWLVG